ncbi:SAF domain-containing protein [Nocardioides sp. SR21]|uniref:SAF domain-containing protein n=1 Tax=Nocardioides sp. SR21 TaxID=2919501 RepID=UPI001FAA2CBD|nr:SAF domain-containing protein [Nocardioides sp. SR21]
MRDRLASVVRPVRRAVLARRRLLAAALTAVAVLAGLHATAAPAPPHVSVPVAARDLPAGTVLSAGDLTPVDFAPGSVPADLSFDAAGRTLAAPLRAGEPVTDVRLVGPALTEGYPGLSAVPVRLPDAGMAGLLRVGDRIDLVAADPQGGGADVVASGVPVLAIPDVEPEVGASGLTGRLVVVGAPPDEVAAIADASVRTFITIAFTG